MSIHKLGALLAKVKRPGKIQTGQYLEVGEYPIIDQGQLPIAGYTDDQEMVIRNPLPMTIFGDHTRAVKFSKEPFACGADGTQLLYPNSENIDPTYFYYAVKNIDLSNYFYARHFKFLKEQEIDIHDEVASQQRIAAILSAYDNLIANNRRRIQLLEDAARLLYREWFVRLRFPGHEHAKIRDGVPEGWEKVQLAKLAEVNRASIGQHFQGEIEYIDISAVSPGHIEQTTTYEFSAAPSRARRVVQHGDIIWSCVRPNRRSHAVIWHPQENLIASTGFAVITPTTVPTSFLYQAVTTDDFVGRLVANARGVAYPAVTAPVFESAQILAPPGALLAQYNEQSEPMLEQISILRQQTQRLARARDLLLPKLMSGEVAV